MRKSTIGNLKRISKRTARKLWGKQDMNLCPCNLRPGPPWQPDMRVFAKDIASKQASEHEHERKAASFDTYVNSFEWYNCPSSETGLYTAFYLVC